VSLVVRNSLSSQYCLKNQRNVPYGEEYVSDRDLWKQSSNVRETGDLYCNVLVMALSSFD
jgi:hypothetical protein